MAIAKHAAEPSLPAETATPQPIAAFAGGAVIGTLGGLIGLGGAEFRLPLLIGPFCNSSPAVKR